MAEQYISKFISSIPEEQRRIMLDRLGSEKVPSAMQFVGLSEMLLITQGVLPFDFNPITKEPQLKNKIKSIQYNEFLEAVRIDLESIFYDSRRASSLLSNFDMMSKDNIGSTRNVLGQMEDEVETIRTLSEEQLPASRFESFSDPGRYRLTGVSIGRDRELTLSPFKQELFNSSFHISKVTKTVLPEGLKEDILVNREENLEADYGVVKSVKTGRKSSFGEGSRDILQRGNSKIWKEVVLADRPVVHYVDDVRMDGVLVKVLIKFTSPKPINSFFLDPITNRDMVLKKIRWKDATGFWRDMVNYEDALVEGESNQVIHIKNIKGIESCNEIEVWMLQRNFRRKVVSMNGNQLYEEQIWDEYQDGDYSDIEYRYSSDELDSTPNPTPAIVRESTIYEDGMDKIFKSKNIKKATREVLNLVKKPRIALDKFEYVFGAYSLSAEDVTYPEDDGIFISHQRGGYGTNLNSIRELEISADFQTPDVTTVEFYISDIEGRKDIPIAPQGTRIWRERTTESSGSPNDYIFETNFPAQSGSFSMFKNGEAISPTLAQLDSTGHLGSNITLSDVYPLEEDIFVAQYVLQGDNRAVGTQRRALVADLPAELDQILTTDSTRDSTVKSIDSNVITLSHYPFFQDISCETLGTSFPFTTDSAPYAIFASGAGNDNGQRLLDNSFVPFMEMYDTPEPGRWALYSINQASGVNQVEFINIDTGGFIRTDTEDPQDDILTEKSIYYRFGSADQRAVGNIRIDWSAVEEWGATSYLNTSIITDWYNPSSLADAVQWFYGKGGIIRPQIMSGLLKGNDLDDPLGTVKEGFIESGCPIYVVVDGTIATDKTKYNQPFQDPLDDYIDSGQIQYFLSGNQIFTNHDFDNPKYAGKTVDVLYWVITKGIRMKAILRTNRKNGSRWTPVLKNFNVKFKGRG